MVRATVSLALMFEATADEPKGSRSPVVSDHCIIGGGAPGVRAASYQAARWLAVCLECDHKAPAV